MTQLFFKLRRSNTILYCRYWTETVHFYKEQLCFPVAFENAWFVEFQLTSTSFLSIANSARATIVDVQGQGVTLTWEVMDLEKTKEHLEMLGIATTPIQRKWGALAFYCTDPEGHRLEFWTQANGKRSSLDE
ncbi:MAG: VOC family protein [Ardenticatenaceae bacterium]|nr:VOC family protein [Ardenticatenaceae bacterium]MCB8948071.1 VOC family protein [Ardenticatenaceae bacterium]